jgi:hypothetical protein
MQDESDNPCTVPRRRAARSRSCARRFGSIGEGYSEHDDMTSVGIASARHVPPAGTHEEVSRCASDVVHGLMVWSLATLLAGIRRRTSPDPSDGADRRPCRRSDLGRRREHYAYDLDRLFRSDRPPAADMTYTRAEVGRIRLTASSHRGITAPIWCGS